MVAKKAAPAQAVKEDSSEPEKFTWEPKAGGEPIVLPHGSRVVPKGKHFWFAHKMDGLTFVGQVKFMLQLAGVTDAEQDHIFEVLDDDETLELVNAWSNGVNGASVGES